MSPFVRRGDIINLFLPWYSWKIAELALNKNQLSYGSIPLSIFLTGLPIPVTLGKNLLHEDNISNLSSFFYQGTNHSVVLLNVKVVLLRKSEKRRKKNISY
jgi:hypothetical protein